MALFKSQAHGRGVDAVSRGNAFADSFPKSEAISSDFFDPHMSLKDIKSMANPAEKSAWRKHGRCDPESVWRGPRDKPCLPKQLFPYMAELAHGLDRISKGGMIDFIAQNLDSIWFGTVAENSCKRCLVYAQHNTCKKLNTTRSAFPTPSSPFQHLKIYFTELTPARGYKYCLVVVDLFSKWVEDFPCKHADAKSTAKHLLQNFISRWGTPEKLSSDNGPHFNKQ